MELSEEVLGLSVEYEGDDRLVSCILKLPAQYREVILLKYEQGYNTREIAQMLKLTVSNTNKILQRAKNKLEKLCR